MNTKAKREAIQWANENPNEEKCGLIVCGSNNVTFLPCNNISLSPEKEFEIDANDYIKANHNGIPYGLFHSHPIGSLKTFSQRDIELSEEMGMPFYLYVIETGEWLEYFPDSKDVKIEGVPFDWGIHDCLGLIRHYYKKNLNILINDHDRDETYEDSDNNGLATRFGEEGFVETETKTILKKHDVLLFNSYRAFPQHLGIFIGNSRMIHHPLRMLSQTMFLEERTLSKLSKVLRHKSML